MAENHPKYDITDLDARAEFENVLRLEGYMRVSSWQDAGLGEKGDRKTQCSLKPRAIAHFYDGSKTGKPTGDVYAFSPKAKALHWPKEYGWHGQRPFTVPTPITPEEIAQNVLQEQKRREKNAAQLRADIESYKNEITCPADAPDETGSRYLAGKGIPLDISPYLRIVQHPAEGTPKIPAGALVVPFVDVRTPPEKLFTPDSEIIGFQWIVEKDFAKRHGMSTDKPYRKNWTSDGMTPRPLMDCNVFWIGDPRGASVVSFAEGLATAATWHILTGLPTGCTCDAARLKRTATEFLKARGWARTRLIIAADDDKITGMTAKDDGQLLGNNGRNKAQAIQSQAPARVYIASPPWPWDKIDLKKFELHTGDNIIKFSDWNDYAVLRGMEAARVAAALRLKEALKYFKSYERKESR